MPATAARIGFIRQEFRRAVSETDGVTAIHGALARVSEDPIPTWFDSVEDAQVLADERQELLSQNRRRFRIITKGMTELIDLDYKGGIPVARYVDTERGADLSVLVSDITLDFAKQSVSMTLWG